MNTKNEYIEKMAAELKVWSTQIDLLVAKAESIATDMKYQYDEDLVDLRAKQHVAAEKLKELQEDSSDAWKTIKESSDKIWDELKTGVNQAVSKF